MKANDVPSSKVVPIESYFWTIPTFLLASSSDPELGRLILDDCLIISVKRLEGLGWDLRQYQSSFRTIYDIFCTACLIYIKVRFFPRSSSIMRH